MVKFGRHLQFYLESDGKESGREPFIVPYTDIRETIGQSREHFCHAWQMSLKSASDEYTSGVKYLWERVFHDLFRLTEGQEIRGMPLDGAIKLYVSTMDEKHSSNLFTILKKIHSSASINSEALRKLVKKFDKGAGARGEDILTTSLIPELYCSALMAYPTLEGNIETLRESLTVKEDEIESLDEDSAIHSIRKHATLSTQDNNAVKRRADELSWLHNTVSNIPHSELSSLVAHRGFHCPRDNSGKRPLENSLYAFESAWAAGVHLCECDVAVTKDGQLVLAHDEDFSRLALMPSGASEKKVSDLTMRDIVGLTFKSGSRPPLLLDVLQSAQAIGGKARLVIEIKPGNQEACTALVRLFRQYPDLIERCAVIMSFDAYTLHKLRSEMDELTASQGQPRALIHRSDSPDDIQTFEVSASPQAKLPELLLLTVAEMPQKHFELLFDVATSDLSHVNSWLQHEGQHALDGLYIQYQKVSTRKFQPVCNYSYGFYLFDCGI
ncbi:hypothetical protein ACHAWF_009814 [Thalassiosira exigua]